MPKDTLNEAEFERLHRFADSFPQGVLTPLILKNWDEILNTSGLAWEYFLEQMEYRPGIYKPMPSVLESILPRPQMQHSRTDTLKVWSNIEKFLHEKGLRSEQLDYFDCGREAIVFKIHKATDVLLKIGMYQELPQTWLQLSTLKRHVEDKVEENSRADSIYVSVTPYLGAPFTGKENLSEQDTIYRDNPAWENTKLKPEVVSRYDELKPTVDNIAQIMKKQGINFDDRKFANLRANTSLPNFFFIVDRRAISKSNNAREALTEEDTTLLEAAAAIQKNLQVTLKMKYGYGEAIFNGLANQAQDKPIISNFDPDYHTRSSKWTDSLEGNTGTRQL